MLILLGKSDFQVDRVSRSLGARSGVEMRAASRAAERIGAQIVLGKLSS